MSQDPGPFSNLRKKAETNIGPRLDNVSDLATLSAEETQKLFHELKVHQIELEMQNEELRQTQNDLEALRDKFLDLYDFSPVAYFTIGETGMIEEANLTGATLLGVERRTLIGQPLSRFIKNESQDTFYLHRKQTLDTQEPQQCEVDMIRNDGSEFCGELKSIAEKEKRGPTNKYRIAISDITQRVISEKEMQRSHNLESLGFLAGGIAHDFNNILTGIFANIQLLKVTLDKSTVEYGFVTDAWDAALKTKNLTAQLLTFATGGAPLKKIAPIEELIQKTTRLSLSGANTKPDFNFSDNLWPVNMDISQMGQVIQNLTINANQAMPHGGTLTVSVENVTVSQTNAYALKAGPYVKVTFTDQGTGMSEETVKHIFDPYFTTKLAGHGLGLSIVHSIIKRHDGHITVHSEIDSGTTFQFFLPASETQIREDDKKDTPLPTGTGKILLMDDEEIILKIVGRILTSLGYVVDTVSDGAQVLETYQASVDAGNPYHIVMMDLTIPGGMGGKETIAHLLQKHPEARAVVTSGYSNDPVMANYQKYGFRGRIHKPIDVEILAETIENVLKE